MFVCRSSPLTSLWTVSLVLYVYQACLHLPGPQGNAGVSDACYHVQPCMVLGTHPCLYTSTRSAFPSPVASAFDLIKSSQDSVRSLVPPPVGQELAIKSFTQGHPSVLKPEQRLESRLPCHLAVRPHVCARMSRAEEEEVLRMTRYYLTSFWKNFSGVLTAFGRGIFCLSQGLLQGWGAKSGQLGSYGQSSISFEPPGFSCLEISGKSGSSCHQSRVHEAVAPPAGLE